MGQNDMLRTFSCCTWLELEWTFRESHQPRCHIVQGPITIGVNQPEEGFDFLRGSMWKLHQEVSFWGRDLHITSGRWTPGHDRQAKPTGKPKHMLDKYSPIDVLFTWFAKFDFCSTFRWMARCWDGDHAVSISAHKSLLILKICDCDSMQSWGFIIFEA